MNNLMHQPFQHKIIIERKIRYDSVIVENECILLKAGKQNIILFHKIKESFTMKHNQHELTIRKGSYTLAYYWKDQPFNLYIWRDKSGSYLGSYFNIVKNTYISDTMVSFEDLIIDILVFPNGNFVILDEDELPVPLNQFENGFANQTLKSLIDNFDSLLSHAITESETIFRHEDLLPLLNLSTL